MNRHALRIRESGFWGCCFGFSDPCSKWFHLFFLAAGQLQSGCLSRQHYGVTQVNGTRSETISGTVNSPGFSSGKWAIGACRSIPDITLAWRPDGYFEAKNEHRKTIFPEDQAGCGQNPVNFGAASLVEANHSGRSKYSQASAPTRKFKEATRGVIKVLVTQSEIYFWCQDTLR